MSKDKSSNVYKKKPDTDEPLWKTDDGWHKISEMDIDFIRTALFHAIKMIKFNASSANKALDDYQRHLNYGNMYQKKFVELHKELEKRGETIFPNHAQEILEEENN